MTPRPPRLATWIIRSSVPVADRDAVLGDFEEEFRARTGRDGLSAARAWYWQQTRRSLPHHAGRRAAPYVEALVSTPATSWLGGSFQDLRRAIRSFRATPGFTIVALLVLALGIGATTAIYSVVDGVVLRGLGYPDDGQLMIVAEPALRTGRGAQASLPEFRDWQTAQTSFVGLGASRIGGLAVSREGDVVESLRITYISASLLPTLRVGPAIGRAFTAADEILGNDHVLLLSDGYWRRHFGARRDVVGQSLMLDTGSWTIVGVMPPSFMYPAALTTPMDLWAPLAPTPASLTRADRPDFSLSVIGRLKPGVTAERAQADIERATTALRLASPPWFAGRGLRVLSLRDSIVGPVRAWMLMLLGSVAFVLLLACVNVANLLLARATTRARDAAVRTALGASRWRIVRGLLIESLVLSSLGTAIGVALAVWGVDALRAALPANLPRLAAVAVNYRVFAAAAALAVGVAIGVTPMWQTSPRTSAGSLRDAGRSGSAGAGRGRARSVLLAAEIALAVVLLIGSGLFVSSFVRLLQVDLGFDTTNVLQADLSPRGKATDAYLAGMSSSVAAIMDTVQRVPGIEKVALVSGTPPLLPGSDRSSITVPNRPPSASDGPRAPGQSAEPGADDPDEKLVSAAYFDVLRVPLVRGRGFTDDDMRQGAPQVVILNDVAATRYFGQDNPIGTLISIGPYPGWTVVGVVRAVRLQGPESDARPEIYTPLNWQAFRGNPLLMLVMRTTSDPGALAPAVKTAIHNAAPSIPTPPMTTYDALFGGLVAQRKFNMLVLALFGGLAIAIAATGIYGVMAYVVEQRTQEIGVRMALGAEPSRVVRMVLVSAVRTMAIGMAIGLAGGWLLARFVQAFLFKGDAHDPLVYAGAGAVLMLSGLVAAIVPARRASAVDPLIALRAQ